MPTLDVARELSQDFDLIRIDLYTDESRIYVGEPTNVSDNAGAHSPRPRRSAA